MKKQVRILSAVCAAACAVSVLAMPAAAYPMHMEGASISRVLQILENDPNAYVEKSQSQYYGLKESTPKGKYDCIFYITEDNADVIQLNRFAYHMQFEKDVDTQQLAEQLCSLLTKSEEAEAVTAETLLDTDGTHDASLTAEGSGKYTFTFDGAAYKADDAALCQSMQTLSGFVSVQKEVWGVSLQDMNIGPFFDATDDMGICRVELQDGASITAADFPAEYDVTVQQDEYGRYFIVAGKDLDMKQRRQLLCYTNSLEQVKSMHVVYAVYETIPACEEHLESGGAAPLMTRGSCSGGDTLSSADAAVILQDAASTGAGLDETLSGTARIAADVNGDGKVNAQDASYLLSYCAQDGAGLQPTWEALLG